MARLFLLFTSLLALSACTHSRLKRDVPGSLIGTVRNPLRPSCGTLRKPKEYCAGKEPAKSCLRIYSAAIRSAEIQCGYELELEHLHGDGEYSDTPYIADRLKQIHRRYKEAGDALVLELEDAYNTASSLTPEQELTYQNLHHSLVEFSSRLNLRTPTTNRMPSSVYNRAIRRQKPDQERVPEIMDRLIIADPHAVKQDPFHP
jgi:hypothetical protein